MSFARAPSGSSASEGGGDESWCLWVASRGKDDVIDGDGSPRIKERRLTSLKTLRGDPALAPKD